MTNTERAEKLHQAQRLLSEVLTDVMREGLTPIPDRTVATFARNLLTYADRIWQGSMSRERRNV